MTERDDLTQAIAAAELALKTWQAAIQEQTTAQTRYERARQMKELHEIALLQQQDLASFHGTDEERRQQIELFFLKQSYRDSAYRTLRARCEEAWLACQQATAQERATAKTLEIAQAKEQALIELFRQQNDSLGRPAFTAPPTGTQPAQATPANQEPAAATTDRVSVPWNVQFAADYIANQDAWIIRQSGALFLASLATIDERVCLIVLLLGESALTIAKQGYFETRFAGSAEAGSAQVTIQIWLSTDEQHYYRLVHVRQSLPYDAHYNRYRIDLADPEKLARQKTLDVFFFQGPDFAHSPSLRYHTWAVKSGRVDWSEHGRRLATAIAQAQREAQEYADQKQQELDRWQATEAYAALKDLSGSQTSKIISVLAQAFLKGTFDGSRAQLAAIARCERNLVEIGPDRRRILCAHLQLLDPEENWRRELLVSSPFRPELERCCQGLWHPAVPLKDRPIATVLCRTNYGRLRKCCAVCADRWTKEGIPGKKSWLADDKKEPAMEIVEEIVTTSPRGFVRGLDKSSVFLALSGPDQGCCFTPDRQLWRTPLTQEPKLYIDKRAGPELRARQAQVQALVDEAWRAVALVKQDPLAVDRGGE